MSGRDRREAEEARAPLAFITHQYSPFLICDSGRRPAALSVSVPFLPRLSCTRQSICAVCESCQARYEGGLGHPSEFTAAPSGHPATFAPKSRHNHHPISHAIVYMGRHHVVIPDTQAIDWLSAAIWRTIPQSAPILIMPLAGNAVVLEE